METTVITSEVTPPAKKSKKRKMSAAAKKALSDAAKARWAAKQSAPAPAPAPSIPQPPSAAILSLQQQVVDLVAQRTEARAHLTHAHSAYLLAQSQFQAAQESMKGIEQEVQYRIGLIAQMENRAPMAPVIQMPSGPSLSGVSSEPTPSVQQGYPKPPSAYPNADDMVSRGHASRDPNALTGSMM